MAKPKRGEGARGAERGGTVLVHPALSSLARDGRGFAVGARRGAGSLRAPDNLKGERDILRFALGMFTALALLEAEDWPFRPSAAQWALGEDGLPALSEPEPGSPAASPALSHGALLVRLLTGKRVLAQGPWPAVSKRHPAAAAWNAWLAGLKACPDNSTMGARLRGLWALAEGTGRSPGLPSSWGVGLGWSPALLGPGLSTLAAVGAHALQATLSTLPPSFSMVQLGGTPPYPFAALEPLVASALGENGGGAWMREHLGSGEEAVTEGLATLLGQPGKGGWLLHPAEALDETSLRVLKGACQRVSAPVLLLEEEGGSSPPSGQARRIRLPWLTPVAEAWYLDHTRALLGSDEAEWLLALERCPPGQPCCAGPLLPPLPEGFYRPARPHFGGRKGECSEGESPEEAARAGRLGQLVAASHLLRTQGAGSEGRFWEGVVLFLVGQPALALSAWDGLRVTGREKGRLWVYRARAFERLQDYPRARAALREALRHPLSSGDGDLACLLEGQLLWVEGRAEEASSRLEPLARRTGDRDAQAQALCHLATQALHANRTEEAMRLLEEARYALAEPPQPLSEFLLLHRTGMALRKAGDFQKALAHFDEARELAASVGFRCLEAWAGCDAGNALRLLRRFEEAMAAFRRAEEGAEALGLARLAESARFDLAVCQAEAGELGPAERAFLAALERGGEDAPSDRATDWYWLGTVRHQRGDYPGALEAAESGIAALGDLKDPEVRLPLLVLRGEVLLVTGQLRKLGYLLRGMEEELGEATDPDDRLAAAALARLAAARGEGRFGPPEVKRAEASLDSASPYFRAYWHLLSAQALGEGGGADLERALRDAREARSAHLACRALLGLAERGALPVIGAEERRRLARFLSENRVRGPERGLLAYLGEAASPAGTEESGLPEDLDLLSRAEAAPEGTLDEILRRLGATCGCRIAPGEAPKWWGSGTAEQRVALAASAGLRGEAPGPGGTMMGYPGQAGLWCGIFRPGETGFSAEEAVLFRLWARLMAPVQEESPPHSPGPLHPAVARLILTRSPAMADLLGKLERAAPFAFPVLITGEAGSGKEVCARAVHEASPRAGKPWIPANCANLSPTLAASQLFGHRRGAFTGADKDREGFVETARGGTLFLDEVGELALEVQGSLLRYLQDGSYTPLGETRERRSDARIVAATNQDLERAMEQGRFRPDLYHRLRVIPIEVPPLRQRPEDIPLLFGHFLARAAREEGVPEPAVEPAVLTRLAAHAWPGNVRELQNLARALLVESNGGHVIREEHLPARMLRRAAHPGMSLAAQVDAAERTAIGAALKESAGNRAAAARLLGISRQALAQKMKRLGM